MFLAQGLSWGCWQGVCLGCIIWRLGWDERLCFQEGSLTWCSKLARGFSFSPHGPLCGLYILKMWWLTSSGMTTSGDQGKSHTVFNDLDLKNHTLSFLFYSVGYTNWPYSVWDGTPKGCKNQEAKIIKAPIIEAHLGNWLHSGLHWNLICVYIGVFCWFCWTGRSVPTTHLWSILSTSKAPFFCYHYAC